MAKTIADAMASTAPSIPTMNCVWDAMGDQQGDLRRGGQDQVVRRDRKGPRGPRGLVGRRDRQGVHPRIELRRRDRAPDAEACDGGVAADFPPMSTTRFKAA